MGLAGLALVLVARREAILMLLACLCAGARREATLLVVLSEQCDEPGLNVTAIRTLTEVAAAEINSSWTVEFLPESEVCGASGGLSSVAPRSPLAVVGSPPPRLCALLQSPAISSATWSCPPMVGRSLYSHQLAPPADVIAAAVAQVFAHFRWKHASIVTSEEGFWPGVSLQLESALRKSNVTVKRNVVLTGNNMADALDTLKRANGRVTVVCASDRALRSLVAGLDSARLAALPQSALLVPGLGPPGSALLGSLRPSARAATLLLYPSHSNNTYDLQGWVWSRLQHSLAALGGVEARTQAPLRLSLSDWVADQDDSGHWRRLITLQCHYDRNADRINVETSSEAPNSHEWSRRTNSPDSNKYETEPSDELDCDEDVCSHETAAGFAVSSGVAYAALAAISSIALVFIAAVILRRQYHRRRVNKRPCKILLTPADFVFPQVQEGRRVDEGIETMLCCWLQQLQEFGGPEVDKPDLLQGSVASLKSSTPSRPPVVVDPRARYNGDLVQLKQLPVSAHQGGTYELRSKALEVLVTLHGLRHENLNPLLGCLTAPPRPALVWEWCSRGSLEDVLVQDEIKLDWGFRLSLLTDLVRGMRYLHSAPHRVHGALTSRNCVIDARWVLKITDYCLNSFYEAQNTVLPPKTARELLWTAPELLRAGNCVRRGTQAADVYSFAIITQEVVVRGEPFCMLSLSPEEILEKLKKPPPLIRPSVSKGAAPPEAINMMRQCWAEQPDMRPSFGAVHDLLKTLNHGRKVNFVDTMFQMLEKYSNNLEDLIRERTEQLDMEKKKTEQLLNRMLPSSVAEKLKLGQPVDPEDFSEVTIYFSDIVGFTTISAYSTPFEVVDLLNDLYTCFDATINAYNVYKVETIGDAYMVVGGLPVRMSDHAYQIATMALDLLHQSGKFKIRHLPFTPLRLRIGIHTGPCCAGVVGLTMPRYCLFGDTVNTASRMESSGAPWRIHISEATKQKLEELGEFQLEYRGQTEIKGKGKMPTYWLLGKAGFDKELPTPPPLGLDESLIMYGRTGQMEESPESPVAIDPLPVRRSRPPPLSTQLSLDPQLLEGPPRSARRWGRQMTFDQASVTIHHAKSPEPNVKKSFSTEQKMSSLTRSDISTPFSASDANVDLFGISFINTSKSTTNLNTAGKRVGENDLSTPYNHYRCLSPSDAKPRLGNSRLLKRQFSVDRGEEGEGGKGTARLCKQHSAGTAHELGRIEEVGSYQLRKGMPTTPSISSESLN